MNDNPFRMPKHGGGDIKDKGSVFASMSGEGGEELIQRGMSLAAPLVMQMALMHFYAEIIEAITHEECLSFFNGNQGLYDVAKTALRDKEKVKVLLDIFMSLNDAKNIRDVLARESMRAVEFLTQDGGDE